MTNELKPRYSITTITTVDGEFAQKARNFTKENNVSHEAIYRKGLECYEKEFNSDLTK